MYRYIHAGGFVLMFVRWFCFDVGFCFCLFGAARPNRLFLALQSCTLVAAYDNISKCVCVCVCVFFFFF